MLNSYIKAFLHNTGRFSAQKYMLVILVLLTVTVSIISAAAYTIKPYRTVEILAAHIQKATPSATGATNISTIIARQDNEYRNAQMQGPYYVQGNAIFAADDQRYLFHGVARDGLEYNCTGDGHFTARELAYMGSGSNTATETYWGANTVRLPLSEGFWLRGQPSNSCTAASYHALVQQTVDILTALRLNVILDLHWSDAGGQSWQGGGQWAMPDSDSVLFWQQVASLYKNYPNVLFELYNEPHPSQWSCWVAGCSIHNDTGLSSDCGCFKGASYTAVGMQTLVNTVRGTGATNLVLAAGINWGYDLSQLPRYTLRGTNIVYVTHPYNRVSAEPSTWNAAFGTISTRYPVISTESGEFYCATNYVRALLAYFDAHQMSWLGWAWVAQGNICSYPRLILNYQGKPTAGLGMLVYQHLRQYH